MKKKPKIDIETIRDEAKEVMEKAKSGLKKIGKETSVFAKRGEKEISRFARLGKTEVGILGLSIQKNRLYYQIGKKVWNLNKKGRLTTNELKKLCSQISKIDRELSTKKRSAAKYMK